LAHKQGADQYITIEDANPLLVFNPNTKTMDYFYKGILPPNGMHSSWGSGKNLYMISNDPGGQAANMWNVIRVNMGTSGVPYF
jgi:hypothetical protein